jgi:hypothetical protein
MAWETPAVAEPTSTRPGPRRARVEPGDRILRRPARSLGPAAGARGLPTLKVHSYLHPCMIVIVLSNVIPVVIPAIFGQFS